MIPKRVWWFGAGLASGFGAAVWSYARVREVRGRYEADQVADTLLDLGRSVAGTVLEAVGEGREAMREAEDRIRTDTDVRPRIVRG